MTEIKNNLDIIKLRYESFNDSNLIRLIFNEMVNGNSHNEIVYFMSRSEEFCEAIVDLICDRFEELNYNFRIELIRKIETFYSSLKNISNNYLNSIFRLFGKFEVLITVDILLSGRFTDLDFLNLVKVGRDVVKSRNKLFIKLFLGAIYKISKSQDTIAASKATSLLMELGNTIFSFHFGNYKDATYAKSDQSTGYLVENIISDFLINVFDEDEEKLSKYFVEKYKKEITGIIKILNSKQNIALKPEELFFSDYYNILCDELGNIYDHITIAIFEIEKNEIVKIRGKNNSNNTLIEFKRHVGKKEYEYLAKTINERSSLFNYEITSADLKYVTTFPINGNNAVSNNSGTDAMVCLYSSVKLTMSDYLTFSFLMPYLNMEITKVISFEKQNRLEDVYSIMRYLDHEYRKPVDNIIEYSSYTIELLKNKNYSDIPDCLEAIYLIASFQKFIIERIHYLLDLEKGKDITVVKNQVDVNNLIIKTSKLFSKDRKIGYSIPIHGELKNPNINCDENLLQLALSEFITNAIYFCKSKVWIELFETKNDITINVLDDGALPKSIEPDRLFRYSQTSKTAGTGSGLMLVKKIMDKHEGKCGFKNEQGNKIFYLQLLK